MFAEGAARFILHALIVLGGGIFIGGAMINFNKKEYTALGINTMLAMLMIKLLWTT